MKKWLAVVLRNLGRNPRRTWLTASIVMVGSCLTVFAWGLEEGAEMGSIENSTGLIDGQVQITSPDYTLKPNIKDTITGTQELTQTLKNTPGVLCFSARTEAFGLVFGQDRSAACLMLGVNPQQETTTTTLNKRITQGRYLMPNDAKGIVVSNDLAKVISAEPGDTLVFLTQSRDGSMGVDRLVLRGVVDARGTKLILAHQNELQSILGLSGVHRVVVRVKDAREAAHIASVLQSKLPNLEVESWEDYLRVLVETSGIMRAFIEMSLFLLVLLAVAGILNTAMVSVSERVREIGLMSALGAKPREIFFQLIAESTITGLVGVSLGLGLGSLLTLWTGKVGIDLSAWSKGAELFGWPNIIYPRTGPLFLQGLIITCASFMLAAIISGLAPALRAARLEPAQAMRFR